MEYRYLGRSGLRVSKLCLGTMNFGPETDEKEAFAIMDRALELGINFFDTANVYGGFGENCGLTEKIIGKWFSQGNGRREKVVLATKVYGSMKNPEEDPNEQMGLSAYKIQKHIENSLKNLQTDHIDLYQMHHIDGRTTWEELWDSFERILLCGKAIYIGSCNFGARNLAYAQAAAERKHIFGLVSEQHKYNLLCRLPELEVLPAAAELGLGVMTWSPLHEGMLSGKLLKNSGGRRVQKAYESLTPQLKEQLLAYSKFCGEMGESEAHISLAWLLSNPVVTTPIIGPRTVEQLEDMVSAADIKLSEEELKKLDEIFPGPGGAGPMCYSW